MTKIDDLKARVKKSQETVEKRKATIARHEKQLAKKITVLEKESGREVDINNIDSYKWDGNGQSYDYYWEACDVASKLNDITEAKKKLKQAEKTLENWQAKLDIEIEKDRFLNDNAPQVIKDFLEDWKSKAYEWHIKRYNDYQAYKRELHEKVKEAEAQVGVKGRIPPSKAQREQLKEMGLDYDTVRKKKASFAGTAILYMETFREEERLEWLEKTLEADKKAKMLDLINRINSVVGEITEASNLKISNAGNLNGVIKGIKADAKVETIGAGGWNIQCFHYRTLVHKI